MESEEHGIAGLDHKIAVLRRVEFRGRGCHGWLRLFWLRSGCAAAGWWAFCSVGRIRRMRARRWAAGDDVRQG